MKSVLFHTNEGPYAVITDGGDIAHGSSIEKAVDGVMDIAKGPVETLSVYDMDPRMVKYFYTNDGELFVVFHDGTIDKGTAFCTHNKLDKSCFTGR